MKKLLSLLLVLATLLALSSCGEAAPKDFSSNGMTITLTDDFKENTQQGYTVCYESSDVAVFVLKESFSLQQNLGELTLDEYAEVVRNVNSSKSPTEISKADGLTSMEYSFFNENMNQNHKYFCTMFKSSDAFWLVQFVCIEDVYDTHMDSFLNWAKSIKFDS